MWKKGCAQKSKLEIPGKTKRNEFKYENSFDKLLLLCMNSFHPYTYKRDSENVSARKRESNVRRMLENRTEKIYFIFVSVSLKCGYFLISHSVRLSTPHFLCDLPKFQQNSESVVHFFSISFFSFAHFHSCIQHEQEKEKYCHCFKKEITHK